MASKKLKLFVDRTVNKRTATVVLVIVAAGCGRRVVPPAGVPQPPPIRGLPVEMILKQRSTTVVPGSDERLRITIDDITAGQVMVSLAGKEGESVLAATSIKVNESLVFKLQGDEYRVTLSHLKNNLVGEDFATVVISSGDPPSSKGGEPRTPSEQDKIERLLSIIESDDRATFIRNGAEHSPEAAADHLRSKWQAAGDEIKTANDFIEKIASKSSLSDEPYRVRLADGSEVLATEYLNKKLSQFERRHAVE